MTVATQLRMNIIQDIYELFNKVHDNRKWNIYCYETATKDILTITGWINLCE